METVAGVTFLTRLRERGWWRGRGEVEGVIYRGREEL
jgi:hypothetical protein